MLEFDSDVLTGEIIPEMNKLRDGGLMRLIDLLVVAKDAGQVEGSGAIRRRCEAFTPFG